MADNDSKKGMRQGLTNYGDQGFSLFLRKSFIKGLGYTDEDLEKPVIGIVNTYSDYNGCHGNIPDLIKFARSAVLAHGGLPLEFPTISLHESFSYPTSMYLRNLMAMDTEEMIRAQPMDACILIGGCDKTVPAQIMGALSAGLPFVQLVTGPMLTGSHRGTRVGACTDCRRLWAQFRAGDIDDLEIAEANNELVPTVGTCGVMGTASTMALMTEALGLMAPAGACAPAVTAARKRIATQTGRIAVDIAQSGLNPRAFLDDRSVHNALATLLAVGGSTNGIIHLTAMMGRMGLPVDLDMLDRLGREIPVLVDLKPSGQGYMVDLHHAGGFPAIARELGDSLYRDAMTVTGQSLGENIDAHLRDYPQDIIRNRLKPIHSGGSIAVLSGNLAPEGAIIKQSAASPELLVHEGRAVVFKGLEDLATRLDDPDLDVKADDILVLQNIGPRGAPGMPEAGLIPIPKKIAQTGVKDMVRISDGRMSGTASGTIVLHVDPESAVGGPLALVQNGDRIKLDVPQRRLDVLISDTELEERRKSFVPPKFDMERGYAKLFHEHITQASQGVDFDFMKPKEEPGR